MTADAAPHAPAGRRAALSGAMYLGITQVSKLLMTTLSTIVIARLLTPDDYGVLAMTAPVLAFVYMFQDLGLNAATIQRASVSQAESTALFWINVTASLILATVLVVIAPGVAWFYGDPRAAWVTAASGGALMLTALQLQHIALLDRDLRFGVICIAEVANALVTFFAATLAAFLLRSYWGLMIGTACGALVQTVIVWSFSRFRPGPVTLRGAGSMVAFGRDVTGFNLVNFFVRNADNVLIARFVGTAALGLYDRSYKLMMLPIGNINAPIARLLLPLLSRLRDDPARYRSRYLFALRLVVLGAAPGVMIATVLSDRLMPFLLGERWAATGPIFFWLGLTGLIQPVANLTGVLFLSSGRARAQMQWGLGSAIYTLIGFVIGLHWGVIGVAASLFVTALTRMPILYWLATRGTAVRPGDLLRAQVEPLIGALLAGLVAIRLAPHLSIVPLLCLTVPLAYALALATSNLGADGRRVTASLLRLVQGAIEPLAGRLLARARPRARPR